MSSYWLEYKGNNYSKLDSDIHTEVCIIGGGITGISIAYQLVKNNIDVVVLERNNICSGTTGNTTGKITSGHGLFYKYLHDSFSKEYAKQYLNANQQAISNIINIINTENIDCDLEIKDNYIYTNDEDELIKIKYEVSTLNELGLDAEYVKDCTLPFNILGAIKIKNQAQFHSVKYVYGLCDSITKNNGKIYIDSTVQDIEHKNDKYIISINNNKVTCKYVVIASHYPIINTSGFYFLKMYQEKSYVIAIETKKAPFDGMFINTKAPILSFRTAKYNDKHLILIAGSNHKVGMNNSIDNSYDNLGKTAHELYPNCKVLYKWTTQDCISLDKIPYIGDYSTLTPNMYVATGFKKWGMTTSNIASEIISSKILNKVYPYEEVFKSTRFQPIKNHEEMTAMIKQTTKSLIMEKINIPDETLKDIENNNGGVITIDNKKVGVYRKDNEVFVINPVCSHLGCELTFNNLDKTWDCPCHGSRFDYTGNVINAPAIDDLK